MSQLLFLSLLVFGTLASGQIFGPCCLKKTVGGIAYTLVNDHTNTDEYGCQSNCVYQNDDIVGSRYCFAKGGQEVKCIKEVSYLERAIDDYAICNKDLEEFAKILAESGNTNYFKHCNGTNVNCTAGECLTIFGDFEMCGRPVVDMHDLSKCKSEIRENVAWLFDSNSQATCLSYQKQTGNTGCPQTRWDPKCNCCKYPSYTTADTCQTDCRCNAVCSWFATFRKCSSYTSACCSCTKYKAACSAQCKGTSEPGYEPSDPPTGCEDCYTENNKTISKECKCNCLCKQILENTGSNCAFPWCKCDSDHAFCCTCDGEYEKYNYKQKCKQICKTPPEGSDASLSSNSTIPPPKNDKCSATMSECPT